jgi:F-type H+-transporting ATPase subunit delta
MAKNNAYALALYAIATESKSETKFHKDARTIVNGLKDEPEFINILTSTKLTKEKRVDIVKATFTKKVNKDFVNAMCLMVENNQFNIALNNFVELNKMFNKLFNIIEGQVITTEKLSKDKISKLEKAMEKKTKKSVELTNIIDAEIIGGIKVVLNDKVYDSTIKGQLEDMKNTLKGAN